MTDADRAGRSLDRIPERALSGVHEVEDDAELGPGEALGVAADAQVDRGDVGEQRGQQHQHERRSPQVALHGDGRCRHREADSPGDGERRDETEQRVQDDGFPGAGTDEEASDEH